MRNQLGGIERKQYDRHPPRGKRQWLLGRIAVKDAVRRWLWDSGAGDIYPAEIQVHNDKSGRPYLTGVHGRKLPELAVSIAHRAETGVAIVRPGPCGIDIEEIAERPDSTYAAACGADELALLAERAAATGERKAVWFARFWTAKEAVAKLLGTGLRGAPEKFEVISAEPDRLTVRVGGRDHLVPCRKIGNPPGLTAREYIVAWTAENEQEYGNEH
jgi:phosphopantetheinyl transferase